MSSELYVLESTVLSKDSGKLPEAARVETLGPDSDRFGRVLFRESAKLSPVPVDPEIVKTSLTRVVESVKSGISAAGITSASITIKLAFNSKVGFAFIGDAGVEASVEVKMEFGQK
jgi:hypothetical protein